MGYKRFCMLVISTAFAFCAATTGDASATKETEPHVTTTAAQWYVGASPGTTLTGSRTINYVIKPGTTFSLVTKIGTSETPIEMTATGVECKGCTIENKETTGNAGKVAFSTGKVLFTGVTVKTPTHCKVVSETGVVGQLLSKTLNGHGDFMNGSTAVARVIPAAGEAASFGMAELQNEGGSCSVGGLYSVNGTLYVDWEVTGSFSVNHTGKISPAIEIADGGPDGGLFLGKEHAEVTGSAVGTLSTGEQYTIK